MQSLRLIWTSTSLLLLVLSILGAAAFFCITHDRIVNGVHLGPVLLEGLTEKEAKEQLENYREELLNTKLTLALGNSYWTVSYRQLGIDLDIKQALSQALAVGREGSLLHRGQQLWHSYTRGHELPFPYRFNRKTLEQKLNELTDSLRQPPQDAFYLIDFATDQVEIIPSKNGQQIDISAVLEALQKALATGEDIVDLQMVPITPSVTTEQILSKQITGLAASFTTYFDPAQTNRVENIRLATASLDNYEIRPGELFSFNAVIGPRTEEAGFQEAPVILNNRVESGLGGGVCQVSTTLYNAALRANLPIVERQKHSLVVGYVPVGTDATVAYGIIDLKFYNNTGGYLVIKTQVAGNKLTIKLYGPHQTIPPVKIVSRIRAKIKPKTVVKEDPTLPKGTEIVEREGSLGYRTEVIRLVETEGIVSKELISSDYYRPVPRVIRVGTASTGK